MMIRKLAEYKGYSIEEDVNNNTFLVFPGGMIVCDGANAAAMAAPDKEIQRALQQRMLLKKSGDVDGETAYEQWQKEKRNDLTKSLE